MGGGIMDLPGAFLHAENDETVVMFIKGKTAELMVHVAPHTQQGEKFLYMRVQKALFDMLKSALLFYRKL